MRILNWIIEVCLLIKEEEKNWDIFMVDGG